LLKPMFNTVAETYDLSNKVLTFGLDKRWRKACAEESTSGKYVVDLCCGTGDLSLQLLQNIAPGSLLVGLDFSKEMLKKAVEKKCKNTNVKQAATSFTFVIADAAHVPIRNGCIDDIRIAFSFRNLIYKNPKAITYLREVARTLKDNRQFTCVETSQPNNSFVRGFFHFYCLRIVPFIGGLISGRKPAYKYLGKSAANFPIPQDIMTMMRKAGFKKAKFKPLFLGIVALYIATK